MKNEEPYNFVWTVVGMAALIIIVVSLGQRVEASDWKAGVFIGSWHKDNGFTCDDEECDYNEDNPGLYVSYRGITLGRYENSYSGYPSMDYGGGKLESPEYSTLLAYEYPLGSWRALDFTVMAGIADGYPDEGGFMENYRAWASLNLRWNVFSRGGPKVWYAYKAAAYGLEFDL